MYPMLGFRPRPDECGTLTGRLTSAGKELLLPVVFDPEIFCPVLFGDLIGCDIEEGGE